MKKRQVCIIFGGESHEHEVSLRSAYTVLSELDTDKFEPLPIGITRDGKWYFYLGDYDLIINGAWEKSELKIPVSFDFARHTLLAGARVIKPDIVFPVIHGESCENGHISALFELLHIKCVGCDTLCSSLCFYKHLTKDIARGLGIPVAYDIVINKSALDDFFPLLTKVCKMGYPVFVKPSGAGSSVGVTRVDNPCELYPAISLALEVCDTAIIEEQVQGCECEIGILQTRQRLILSEVGKISHDSDFYDYDTKYKNEGTGMQIPADISEGSAMQIEKYARMLWNALGCKSLSRFDFFVKSDGSVIFNEVNTLPGFTSKSMYPMLFKERGYSIKELISAILNS